MIFWKGDGGWGGAQFSSETQVVQVFCFGIQEVQFFCLFGNSSAANLSCFGNSSQVVLFFFVNSNGAKEKGQVENRSKREGTSGKPKQKKRDKWKTEATEKDRKVKSKK